MVRIHHLPPPLKHGGTPAFYQSFQWFCPAVISWPVCFCAFRAPYVPVQCDAYKSITKQSIARKPGMAVRSRRTRKARSCPSQRIARGILAGVRTVAQASQLCFRLGGSQRLPGRAGTGRPWRRMPRAFLGSKKSIVLVDSSSPDALPHPPAGSIRFVIKPPFNRRLILRNEPKQVHLVMLCYFPSAPGLAFRAFLSRPMTEIAFSVNSHSQKRITDQPRLRNSRFTFKSLPRLRLILEAQ